MQMRPFSAKRRTTMAAAAAVLAIGTAVAGCGGDDSGDGLSGQIAGAGASSQAAAMDAWIAGYQDKESGVTVSYDPVGSGGGREQFIAGGTLFGGSDAPLSEEELPKAYDRCGGKDNLIQIPGYVSPIAIAYNLPGVETLNLKPDVLAGIFNRDITRWDDAKIKADNPDVELPSSAITPVNRSDESGTTENFTEYLSAAAPNVWKHEPSGNWPVSGGEAAQGTSGVVAAIRQGEGSIGYADASQVGDLGVANVGVGDQFVGPSPEAAAKILDASPRNEDAAKYSFTYKLDRKTEAEGTYPITLVAYQMACTKYSDANDAKILKGFLQYVVSEDGQNTASQQAGSAPISSELRDLITPAIDAIDEGGN